MIFVDTNYFLRFLLADVKDQHREAKKLFEQGSEGALELFSSSVVFFEIYWLFKSLYKKRKEQIYHILKDILEMKFVFFEESELLKEALEVYKETNLGLEDSYNLVYAKSKEGEEFKTFDKKLLKKWKTQK